MTVHLINYSRVVVFACIILFTFLIPKVAAADIQAFVTQLKTHYQNTSSIAHQVVCY